jgi:hypothetical protein
MKLMSVAAISLSVGNDPGFGASVGAASSAAAVVSTDGGSEEGSGAFTIADQYSDLKYFGSMRYGHRCFRALGHVRWSGSTTNPSSKLTLAEMAVCSSVHWDFKDTIASSTDIAPKQVKLMIGYRNRVMRFGRYEIRSKM